MTKAFLALLLAITSLVFGWAQEARHSGRNLEGAWEFVSGEMGGKARSLPEGAKQVKLICSNHFVWVFYDAKGKPSATAGGTYTFHGDSYTEHIDFMNVNGADQYIGKDQPFTVRIDGDTLTQTGSLSDGQKLSEKWKRVR